MPNNSCFQSYMLINVNNTFDTVYNVGCKCEVMEWGKHNTPPS